MDSHRQIVEECCGQEAALAAAVAAAGEGKLNEDL